MSTSYERLLEAAKEKFPGVVETPSDLGRLINESSQTLTNWKNRGLPASKITKLAKAVGVLPEWLETGEGTKRLVGEGLSSTPLRSIAAWDREEDLDSEHYVFLPALALKLSAGAGAPTWFIEEEGQKQAFTRKWAERHCIDPASAATMVVSGNSMEPRLLDGDSVVVDYCRNDVIIDGRIYAILLNGEFFIKRLFKEIGGGVRVVSDNPDKTRFPDRVVPVEHMEHLKIIGMAIAVSGGL